MALAAFSIYRYRVGHLLEVANIRTHIAADLHDDIGANLTRIAILSEVARRRFGDESEEGPLSAIAGISRESVASMSDIVWAINPERDTLVDVVRRMRRQAEEVFASDHTSLEFSASGTDDNVKLGPIVRRDLFLTFKEALNNAARHAHCSRVEVVIGVEGRWLTLRVTDNGSGFDTHADPSGQGLTSMRRRARRMNGTLEIDSVHGKGTTVLLRVPCRPRRGPHMSA
jgi:signal transduction histidine kinase